MVVSKINFSPFESGVCFHDDPLKKLSASESPNSITSLAEGKSSSFSLGSIFSGILTIFSKIGSCIKTFFSWVISLCYKKTYLNWKQVHEALSILLDKEYKSVADGAPKAYLDKLSLLKEFKDKSKQKYFIHQFDDKEPKRITSDIFDGEKGAAFLKTLQKRVEEGSFERYTVTVFFFDSEDHVHVARVTINSGAKDALPQIDCAEEIFKPEEKSWFQKLKDSISAPEQLTKEEMREIEPYLLAKVDKLFPNQSPSPEGEGLMK